MDYFQIPKKLLTALSKKFTTAKLKFIISVQKA